jgi:glycosyltransferase involved in cell wall biosynthesis
MSCLPAAISAVLPALNEVAVIARTARRTHAALVASGVATIEVIVVDDGSNDGTGAAVRTLAAELPQVRLLTHPRNLGYGAALRTGFEAATGEAVWLLDSD